MTTRKSPAGVASTYTHHSRQRRTLGLVRRRSGAWSGRSAVRLRRPTGSSHGLKIVVTHAGSETNQMVNLRKSLSPERLFHSPGEFSFKDGARSASTIPVTTGSSYPVPFSICR